MRSLGGAIIVLAGALVLVASVTAGGRGGLENVFLAIVGLILAAIGLVGWIFGDPPPPKAGP